MIRIFPLRTLTPFLRSRSVLPFQIIFKHHYELHDGLCSHSISTHSPKFPSSGMFENLKDRMKWFDYSKSILRAGGFKLYANTADRISHEQFFEVLGLPDSLFSWFLVLELHVWMVMARVMAEKEGRFVRNIVVEAMWEDVRMRIKKLEVDTASNISNTIQELSQQFGAAIIGYDEGILSDDRCLAGALWRRLLQQKYGNAATLEMLVHYVREQMHELDKLSREEILISPNFKWKQIVPIKTA